jgi:hypothetical protein
MISYVAATPVDPSTVVEGAEVAVPAWRAGRVTGWTSARVIDARKTTADPGGIYAIVHLRDEAGNLRIDENRHAGYFAYSLGAPGTAGRVDEGAPSA